MIEGLRLLLVDSSTDEADMYALALGQMGAYVALAMSMPDGLATVSHEPFDVVVSDIWFPQTHGYDLARAARAAGIPVTMIALGDISEPAQEGRALAAGFDAYCPRPCLPRQLASHIIEVLSATRKRDAESS